MSDESSDLKPHCRGGSEAPLPDWGLFPFRLRVRRPLFASGLIRVGQTLPYRCSLVPRFCLTRPLLRAAAYKPQWKQSPFFCECLMFSALNIIAWKLWLTRYICSTNVPIFADPERR